MQNKPVRIERRQALKSLAGATGALMWPQGLLAAAGKDGSDRLGELLPQRLLGRTDLRVTMLGIGGWHVGQMAPRDAQELIEAALAGGVRFFDTAESYQDGRSEQLYGELLTPKYREDVFLMTKTTARNATAARQHLEGSLKRLKTDVVDLWQVHALGDPEDVDTRLGGGVLEEMLRQQAAGRVRQIGFTGHRGPAALQRMLEETDVPVTCQMPVNVLDPGYESFVNSVLPPLMERGIAVLAMKTLANGRFFDQVIPGRVSLSEALSFAWSLPISVLIYGPDDVAQLQQTLQVARSFSGLDETGRQRLVHRVADLAGNKLEYYKA
jgi:uncharacterized protein